MINRDIFAKYIEYFKPCKRIKIKLIDGKEYTVCNYVKKENIIKFMMKEQRHYFK